MSNFFKSVWFKCISFLLILAVVIGGLLSVLNTVLYVTPGERTDRAIKKIYDGQLKSYETVIEGNVVECSDFGSIDKIYLVGGETENDYDYLFHATGIGGFQNGSITYWIKVTCKDGKLSVGNMLIESNKKQSFIGSLTSDWHSGLYVDIDEESNYFTTKKNVATDEGYSLIPTTGATNSKNASCNAVNCVIYYMNNFDLGGENEN